MCLLDRSEEKDEGRVKKGGWVTKKETRKWDQGQVKGNGVDKSRVQEESSVETLITEALAEIQPYCSYYSYKARSVECVDRSSCIESNKFFYP